MEFYRRFAVAILLSSGALVAQTPKPNSVQNPASNILPGLPNFGIAQGSIFVVYGSGLGPTTISIAPSVPLPKALSGTAVQVAVNGTTLIAPLVYTLDKQVAGILPSNTPAGTGTLTVTYNGASGSMPIQVVNTNFGISTVNQTGGGAAVVTFPDYALVTNDNAARPGDTLILWGTGLGPITGDDAATPAPGDLGTPVTLYIGGVQAEVRYRGRSSEPGLDQMNFVVPAGVTGCAVSLAVQTGNLVSNTTTMPISATGGPCADPNGVSYSSLAPDLNGKGSASVALIDLLQQSISVEIAGSPVTTNSGLGEALFERFDATHPISSGTLFGQTSIGSCTVSIVNAAQSSPVATMAATGLDAGAAITANPPSGAQIRLTTNNTIEKGFYSGAVPALVAGAYVFSNGSGGADIGAFQKNVIFPPALQWTNQSAVSGSSIDRTKPLTLTWSGGDPSSYAFVNGTSSTVADSTAIGASFYCVAPVSAGQFVVPAAVLLSLPATGGRLPGSLMVGSISAPAAFTAPGLDFGYIMANTGSGISVSYK